MNKRQVFEAADAAKAAGWIFDEVVSGTARGADSYGEEWAKANNIPIKRFPADWDGLGRGAGHIRNAQMADYADALLLVWQGTSPGSKNMLARAKAKKLRILESVNGELLEHP